MKRTRRRIIPRRPTDDTGMTYLTVSERAGCTCQDSRDGHPSGEALLAARRAAWIEHRLDPLNPELRRRLVATYTPCQGLPPSRLVSLQLQAASQASARLKGSPAQQQCLAGGSDETLLLHMSYTGHAVAVDKVLYGWRDLIRGQILDCGCGAGDHTLFAAVLALQNLAHNGGPAMEAVGVDASAAACRMAERGAKDMLGPLAARSVRFVVGDIGCAPRVFTAPSDLVLATFIWPWVADRLDSVLVSLADSVEPVSGHVIVMGEFPDGATPSPYSDRLAEIGQGVSLPTIIKTARRAGLDLVRRTWRMVIPPPPGKRHRMFAAAFRRSRG